MTLLNVGMLTLITFFSPIFEVWRGVPALALSHTRRCCFDCWLSQLSLQPAGVISDR